MTMESYNLQVRFNKSGEVVTCKVNAKILFALAEHGATQKANDAYASISAKGGTLGQCREKFYTVLEALAAGDWESRERLTTLEKLVRAVTAKRYNGKWSKLDTAGQEKQYAATRANEPLMATLTAEAEKRDAFEASIAAL